MASDTILCHDKEEAKYLLDVIGARNVADWEFLAEGKVKLILNCSVEQLKESEE